jgi:hypothetical protein
MLGDAEWLVARRLARDVKASPELKQKVRQRFATAKEWFGESYRMDKGGVETIDAIARLVVNDIDKYGTVREATIWEISQNHAPKLDPTISHDLFSNWGRYEHNVGSAALRGVEAQQRLAELQRLGEGPVQDIAVERGLSSAYLHQQIAHLQQQGSLKNRAAKALEPMISKLLPANGEMLRDYIQKQGQMKQQLPQLSESALALRTAAPEQAKAFVAREKTLQNFKAEATYDFMLAEQEIRNIQVSLEAFPGIKKSGVRAKRDAAKARRKRAAIAINEIDRDLADINLKLEGKWDSSPDRPSLFHGSKTNMTPRTLEYLFEYQTRINRGTFEGAKRRTSLTSTTQRPPRKSTSRSGSGGKPRTRRWRRSSRTGTMVCSVTLRLSRRQGMSRARVAPRPVMWRPSM